VFPNFPSNKNGKQALSVLLVDLLQRATPPTKETSSVWLRNILKTKFQEKTQTKPNWQTHKKLEDIM
jgi:hypothetical protein